MLNIHSTSTNALIQHSLELCGTAAEYGGTFAWEWPEYNELWKDEKTRAFINSIKAMMSYVATAAVGLTVGDGKYVKKRWLIATTNTLLAYLCEQHSEVPEDFPEDAFVECRGQAAKRSGKYTIEFADLIWNSVLNNVDHDEQEYGQAMPVSKKEDDGPDGSHGYAAAPAGSSAQEKAAGRSSWTRWDRGKCGS